MLVKTLLSNVLDFEQALQRQIPFPPAIRRAVTSLTAAGGTVWISATSRLLRNATSATSEQQRHKCMFWLLVSKAFVGRRNIFFFFFLF